MLENKLILDSESKIDLIEIQKITHITVDAYCCEIYFIEGTKCHSSKALSFFESSLPDSLFFRINRNTIVNLLHIENVNKLSRKIKIKGDIVLCISARQLKNLVNLLKQTAARSKLNA